jgi:4-alpha-glucanotransferase
MPETDAEAILPGLIPVGYQHVTSTDKPSPWPWPRKPLLQRRRCRRQPDPARLGPERFSCITCAAGDGGFGDTQALEDLARVAGERGAEALAISPLHAMFSQRHRRYSPYSPSSRLFLNSAVRAPGTILGERAMRMPSMPPALATS